MNSADFLVIHRNNINKWFDNMVRGTQGKEFKSPYRSYKREDLENDHATCYGEFILWITPKIVKCKEFIKTKKGE